jgi:hypothetical protein
MGDELRGQANAARCIDPTSRGSVKQYVSIKQIENGFIVSGNCKDEFCSTPEETGKKVEMILNSCRSQE